MRENRRMFLRGAAIAAGGFTLNGLSVSPQTSPTSKSRVSLVTGNNRRDLISKAIEPFRDYLKSATAGKQIFIKPNVVDYENPMAVTDVDTLRAILDFFSPMTDRTIVIGESTASKRLTTECFEKHGYPALTKEYNVELLDTALGPYTRVYWLKKWDDTALDAYITTLVTDPKRFVISVAILKTHSNAVCTLALKNFAMGITLNFLPGHPCYISADENSRSHMHWGETGPKGLSTNIALMAKHILPGFAIIDGYVGMENEGPTRGTPVEHRVAVAGPDVVSVDRVGLELMGIDYNVVKHVQWTSMLGRGEGNLTAIDIIGESLDQHRIKYKMHPGYSQQIAYQAIVPHPDWTGVDEELPIPLALVNYPNPFNESTMIQFSLPVYSYTGLSVFSTGGQRVRKIVDSHLPAGKHSFMWNGCDDDGKRVASGTYLLQLNALSHRTNRKISFIK
jgi:uncharacterized protein (DUF362 family)